VVGTYAPGAGAPCRLCDSNVGGHRWRGTARPGGPETAVIIGYTGLVGMGKTMLAVREAVRLARVRGAILASNIEVTAPDLDVVRIGVGDDGLEGIPDLLARARSEGRGVVIFVDEIGIVLPSRFWERGMSIDLMWACSQSRKLGADLIFTCQHVAQLDAFLRRITDWIWRVKAIPHPSIERRERGKRPWFFLASRWRPADIDTERPEKRLSRASWWGGIWYRRDWERLYNTDELVRPPSQLRGHTPSSSRRGGPIRRGNSPGVPPSENPSLVEA